MRGSGVVTCHLYELPSSSTLADASSFLLCERDKLKLVRRVDQRVIERKTLNFRFSGLTSMCSYALCIELNGGKGEGGEGREGKASFPSVCHFRTLMRTKSATSSMVVMSVEDRDYCYPTQRISKLMAFMDKSLSPLPVHLLHCQSSLDLLPARIRECLPTLPSRCDVSLSFLSSSFAPFSLALACSYILSTPLYPMPYALCPIPSTLCPIPYTLYPIPYTLYPLPSTPLGDYL